jgi:hypothetical protein
MIFKRDFETYFKEGMGVLKSVSGQKIEKAPSSAR